jgi:hypothetical protein
METYRLSQNGYRMLKPYASAKLIFTNIFHIMDITCRRRPERPVVRVGSCSSNGLPGYLPSPLPWNKTKDKELLGSTLTSPRLLANASQRGIGVEYYQVDRI